MQQHSVGELRDQLFVARMSQRYHEARQRFFGILAQIFKFVSAFSATAVFFSIQAMGADFFGLSGADVAKSAGILLGVLQFVDFFAGFETRSNQHEALRKDYLTLQAEAESVLSSGEVSSKDVVRIKERRFSIEASEKPSLYWLSCRAFNEQVDSQTEPGNEAKERIEIPFLQKIFIHFGDFAGHN